MHTETKASTLGFKISGEYLTDLVRNFVVEGKWRTAFKLLMEDLEGITYQQAIEVLTGTSRLTGINEIEIVPDSSADKIAESLKFVYREIFQYQGSFYRPYGYVAAYGYDDYKWANEAMSGNSPQMVNTSKALNSYKELSLPAFKESVSAYRQDVCILRPFYYARNPSTDICFRTQVDGLLGQAVLCEKIDVDYPLWLTAPATLEHAHQAVKSAFDHGIDFFQLNPTPSGVGNSPFEQLQLPQEDALMNEITQAESELEASASEALDQDFSDSLEDRARRLITQIQEFAQKDSEYGFKSFTEYNSGHGRNITITVPYRAFICAALSRAHLRSKMPTYKAFSNSGMKMSGDCPYHTDAWLGTGLPLEDAYNEALPEQELFMSKLYQLQQELSTFSFDVLAKSVHTQYVAGDVIHDPEEAHPDKILVIKSASSEYADAAVRCAAVICETGSKLAHLTVVSREHKVPVIRIAQATTLFADGSRVSIDFTDGTISVM